MLVITDAEGTAEKRFTFNGYDSLHMMAPFHLENT